MRSPRATYAAHPKDYGFTKADIEVARANVDELVERVRRRLEDARAAGALKALDGLGAQERVLLAAMEARAFTPLAPMPSGKKGE